VTIFWPIPVPRPLHIARTSQDQANVPSVAPVPIAPAGKTVLPMASVVPAHLQFNVVTTKLVAVFNASTASVPSPEPRAALVQPQCATRQTDNACNVFPTPTAPPIPTEMSALPTSAFLAPPIPTVGATATAMPFAATINVQHLRALKWSRALPLIPATFRTPCAPNACKIPTVIWIIIADAHVRVARASEPELRALPAFIVPDRQPKREHANSVDRTRSAQADKYAT